MLAITKNVAVQAGRFYVLDCDAEKKGWKLYNESTQYKNGKEVTQLETIKEKLEGQPDGMWLCRENLSMGRVSSLPKNFPDHPPAFLNVKPSKLFDLIEGSLTKL